MFEQKAQPLPPRLAAAGLGPHLEQQVGDEAAQLLIDERARNLAQGGPAEAPGQGDRQAGAQERGGLFRVGEYQTEQPVVTRTPLTLTTLTGSGCHH